MLMQKLVDAFQLHQQGQLDEAGRRYKEILEMDSQNFDVLHLLGLLSHQLGASAEAEYFFLSAITIKPDFFQVYSSYARYLHDHNRLDDAFSCYAKSALLKSDDADIFFDLGVILQDMKRFSEALESFDKALSVRFDFAMVHNNRGVVLRELGRYEEAVASFERAIMAQPLYALAYSNRASALKDLGRFKDAIVSHEVAITIDPQQPDFYFNRGNVLLELDMVHEAMENFGRAIFINPTYVEAIYARGNALLKLERFEDAIVDYDQALLAREFYPQAYLSCGEAFNGLKRFEEAIICCNRAVEIDPTYADAFFNAGNALKKLHFFDQALLSWNKALVINPKFAEVFYNQGILFKELNRVDEALASYDSAIVIKKDYAEALLNRGVLLSEINRFEDALLSYEQAIDVKPDFFEAYNNRGVALQKLKRFDDALASYDKAISIKGNYEDAYNNRGNALMDLNRQHEALASYEVAISIKADYADAHNNRGNVLMELVRFDEALASYGRAIDSKFDFSEAHCGRANALRELQRFDEALESYEQAASINPDCSIAVYNAAVTFQSLKRFNEARIHYQKFLEIESVSENLNVNIRNWFEDFYSLDLIPASFLTKEELNLSWTELGEKLDRCLNALAMDPAAFLMHRPVITRFLFNLTGFYIAYFQKNEVEVMTKYSTLVSKALGVTDVDFRSRKRRPGKIRLGVASGLLKKHNGAYWAYHWLANLPKDYEFFTYAFNTDADELTRMFGELGTHRSLRFDRENFTSAIETMRADDLDILMLPDVGMTSSSRVLSCYRIAPIQFTAWGHPVTTGSSKIDYYLSSDLMEPENAQSHYSETLVRLPNLALFLTPPSPRTSAPEQFDLPKDAVLYGCLQSLFKYLPQYDYVFPQIAKETPEAFFVFLEGTPTYTGSILKQRLSQVFSDCGLEFERHVKFLPRVSTHGYLDLVARMDVILDSIGWTGGNTSLQAIELGKPIVTTPGEFMRGRHTSAMFRMMGLENHVSMSVEDYIERAIRLGSSMALRAQTQLELSARKHLLYEDHLLIKAFDDFLKSAFAQGLLER